MARGYWLVWFVTGSDVHPHSRSRYFCSIQIARPFILVGFLCYPFLVALFCRRLVNLVVICIYHQPFAVVSVLKWAFSLLARLFSVMQTLFAFG